MKGTRVELLERAQELLEASITLIEEATEDNANVREYLVNQLKCFASNRHGFLSDNLNLDKVIMMYERMEYGKKEEEIEYSIEVSDIMEGQL